MRLAVRALLDGMSKAYNSNLRQPATFRSEVENEQTPQPKLRGLYQIPEWTFRDRGVR